MVSVLGQAWFFFREAAVYILAGIVAGGLLKALLPTEFVAAHLGRGKFLPVFKAALLGIPLPLCSCGVVPAATALKKQGANNGATMAFLISTPESGVDSISISYALLDPILTVARPLAAFLTAMVAGILENTLGFGKKSADRKKGVALPAAGCGCDGGCAAESVQQGGLAAKLRSGLRFAVDDLWADIVGWFFLGLLLAGIIATVLPDDLVGRYLGGGLSSMLLMLVAGVPMYICATASTPIAAALLLKGVSPGAALVFLLAGPATNMMSLSVLLSLFGKKATAIYLFAIAVVSLLCGAVLDWVYRVNNLSAKALAGRAGEIFPAWLELAAVAVLLCLTARLAYRRLRRGQTDAAAGCGCGTASRTGLAIKDTVVLTGPGTQPDMPQHGPTEQLFPKADCGCGKDCQAQRL